VVTDVLTNGTHWQGYEMSQQTYVTWEDKS
jgi:hypothetical protein